MFVLAESDTIKRKTSDEAALRERGALMKKSTVAVLAVVFLLLGALLGYGTHSLIYRERGTVDEGKGAILDTTEDGAGEAHSSGGAEEDTKTPPPYQPFNVDNAMQHIRYLSMSIGPRPQGTVSERKAADYVGSQFLAYGYEEVEEQSFPLKNGLTSWNVYVEDPGSQPAYTIIVGAHMDTIGGPGANDNASGVGVVLELARVFRSNQQAPNLRFVAFGAEEITEGYGKPNHHYGSKHMAAQLAGEKGNVIGMISLDMIGVGSSLYINATMRAPKTLLDLFYAYATKQRNATIFYRQDPGWSDHESFEDHGISAIWLEYRDDPNYHSPRDTFDRISASCIRQVGELVQGFLESLDATACAQLDAASNYR